MNAPKGHRRLGLDILTRSRITNARRNYTTDVMPDTILRALSA